MFSFNKYHGLGNDFIFIDNRQKNYKFNADEIIKICDRNFGIGADGIVLVECSEKADIKMTIFNSDGSNPNMCGNAIRCFGKYVYDKAIIQRPVLQVDTAAGIMKLEMKIENNKVSTVTVNMGNPVFDYDKIPCSIKQTPILDYEIRSVENIYKVTSLLMGVPHTVVFTEDISDSYVLQNGSIIENAEYFPKRTNVNFVKILSSREIIIRTWERGAGYTLACGTGACASVVAGIITQRLENKVRVHLRGGDLLIEWKDNEAVYMTGTAQEVFEGEYFNNNYENSL